MFYGVTKCAPNIIRELLFSPEVVSTQKKDQSRTCQIKLICLFWMQRRNIFQCCWFFFPFFICDRSCDSGYVKRQLASFIYKLRFYVREVCWQFDMRRASCLLILFRNYILTWKGDRVKFPCVLCRLVLLLNFDIGIEIRVCAWHYRYIFYKHVVFYSIYRSIKC